MKPGQADWLKREIEAYTREFDTYQLYADVLKAIFNEAGARFASQAIVSARPKSLSSFAGKCMLKKDKYAEPSRQLTDLAGARIIVLTEEEAEQIGVFIRDNFLIDQANSEDCTARLAAREFGYRGIHFVVQLSQTRDNILGIATHCKEIGDRKAEIQVHTLLQSAWAAIGHDRIYKSPFDVPKKLERAGAQVSALLETSDKEFGRLVNALDEFSLDGGVAVRPDELLRHLVDLSVLRFEDHDPKSCASYALQQAQLARSLRAWELVARFLDEVKLDGVPARLAQQIQLGLGRALVFASKYHTTSGFRAEKTLRELLPPTTPHELARIPRATRELWAKAAAALAKYLAGDLTTNASEIACLYRFAMQCDPTNPYHLSDFIDFESKRLGHSDYVELLRPGLLAAINTCQEQSEVLLEIPQAFFVPGKFYLLLNQRDDALREYAKGVHVCLDPETCICIAALEEEYRHHENLRLQKLLPPETIWVSRLLQIAIALKSDPCHSCAACTPRFQAFSAGGNKAQQQSEEIGTLSEVMSQLQAAATKDLTWPKWPETICQSLPCLKSERIPATQTLQQLKVATPPDLRPVLIVAGGTDIEVAHRMDKYRDHLLQALLHYQGTIYSGGTIEGIPGLVGDVIRETRALGNRKQRLVGYLPQEPLPPDAHKSPYYDEIHRTDSHGFTFIEPLQNWIDLIAGGVKPSDVRLLGINGGLIASAEYRLALALGASVAVVESSGRAVAELLPELHWYESKNLLVLPADRMSIRAFVMQGQMLPLLSDKELDEAARKVHENFLKEKRYKLGDPFMVPYDYLTEDRKETNRQQVAYWIQIIAAAGYAVRRIAATMPAPIEFPPDEVEFMAEMEHGRWVVERLRQGWRRGPKRDPDKKLSPYLVAWEELPDEVKGWDRKTIRDVVRILAEAGIEVYRR